MPGWVAEQVLVRQADNRALIDELSGPPLVRGGQPWVPTPAPPLAGGPQAGGEKTELPSAKITVGGDTQMPALIGFTSNVSEQTMQFAGDAILLLVAEAATVGLAEYLVAQLDAASATAAGIAGRPRGRRGGRILARSDRRQPLGDRDRAARRDAERLPLARVRADRQRDHVVARGGVWVQTDEPTSWMLSEPAIGGREVSAFVSAVFEAGTGAVAKVTAT